MGRNLGITSEIPMPHDFDSTTASPVDPRLESDQNPNISEMLHQFNEKYFARRLKGYTMRWNSQLKVEYDRCNYHTNTIHVSKGRHESQRRSVLVKTILHETIHAYLDKTGQDRAENSAHSRAFRAEKRRISVHIGEDIDNEEDVDLEIAKKLILVYCCKRCGRRVQRGIDQAPQNEMLPDIQKHKQKCSGTFEKL
ncbi:sprT-like domain-containing protein Spartan [Orussus abietinus]|uniref:sprT-like domain-containing protein Spartan n=1 Tax=Orussus abietinus TaxID=222816 RepID=UPI000625CEB0|nr:sprT-like domain-containing protein Spartan [Orussus abietinus]